MNVSDLSDLLKRLEDRAGEQKAMQDLMTELSTTLSDILEHQEASFPKLATAMADALKGVRLNAAPEVKVDVKPTPVEVKVEPKITVEVADGTKSFTFTYGFVDGMTGKVITGGTVESRTGKASGGS